jgi:hypothetical protein
VRLLLQMTEPMWGTGKVDVIDSGLCVLHDTIELSKKDFFQLP